MKNAFVGREHASFDWDAVWSHFEQTYNNVSICVLQEIHVKLLVRRTRPELWRIAIALILGFPGTHAVSVKLNGQRDCRTCNIASIVAKDVLCLTSLTCHGNIRNIEFSCTAPRRKPRIYEFYNILSCDTIIERYKIWRVQLLYGTPYFRETFDGSFLAASRPIFAIKYYRVEYGRFLEFFWRDRSCWHSRAPAPLQTHFRRPLVLSFNLLIGASQFSSVRGNFV